VQVAADKAEVSVLKMHHVCTVGTWGGEASKGSYFSVRSVRTLQTSQPIATYAISFILSLHPNICKSSGLGERERERDLLEIGKSMEMHLTGQKMCAETLHTLSCPSNKHLAL